MAIQFPSIHGSGIKEAQSVSVINIFISCFRYLLLLLLRIAEDRQNVENGNVKNVQCLFVCLFICSNLRVKFRVFN